MRPPAPVEISLMHTKQLPLAPPAPALTDPQRWALQLAEAHGWGVQVEAAGARITLRHGRPGYGLVLYASDAARAADERGRGPAPSTPSAGCVAGLLPHQDAQNVCSTRHHDPNTPATRRGHRGH